MPYSVTAARILPSSTGSSPLKRSCISVPPAKSTPYLIPRSGTASSATTEAAIESPIQKRRCPRKSILVSGRMNSNTRVS